MKREFLINTSADEIIERCIFITAVRKTDTTLQASIMPFSRSTKSEHQPFKRVSNGIARGSSLAIRRVTERVDETRIEWPVWWITRILLGRWRIC